MKNPRFLFIALFAATLTSSCNPKFYSPNTHNAPLLSHRGEVQVTAAGNVDQLELQGAYAITDGFGLIAGGGLFIPSDEENGNGGSGSFLEAGAGFFTPVSSDFVFETYGLFGFGSFENHLPGFVQEGSNAKGDISANLTRFGIQPNFGYKSEYFSVGVSSRIVHVGYNNIKGDLVHNDTDQIRYLKDHRSNFMIEPALTLRAGVKKMKLQIQVGKSFNLTNSDFHQDDLLLTCGFHFNF